MRPGHTSCLVLVSALLAMSCKSEFAEEEVDIIVGDWDLTGAEGDPFDGCTDFEGTLEIRDDFRGEFDWTRDCGDQGIIEENSAVLAVDIKEPNREYDMDVQVGAMLEDWDCTRSVDGSLSCLEEGNLIQFEFVKIE